MTLSIAIAGAAGRMGRALITAVQQDERVALVGGTEQVTSGCVGTDLGLLDGKTRLGATVTDNVTEACLCADVWIDFTTPAATLSALAQLSATPVKAAIIGTTGFDANQVTQIKAVSEHLVIVQSGNFSLGVNLVTGLVRQAAARLGPNWDIEILEAHHRHKVDAPSGTALMLGRAAAQGRDVDHEAVANFSRHGQTGPRAKGDIGYAALRAGGIIGDHDVIFAAEDEIVTISHKAQSRTIFAKGALAAALWAVDQKPGLYTMDDVLGL
jgi:4-hydroxy-tetrahydrodipicolinate reductase